MTPGMTSFLLASIQRMHCSASAYLVGCTFVHAAPGTSLTRPAPLHLTWVATAFSNHTIARFRLLVVDKHGHQ